MGFLSQLGLAPTGSTRGIRETSRSAALISTAAGSPFPWRWRGSCVSSTSCTYLLSWRRTSARPVVSEAHSWHAHVLRRGADGEGLVTGVHAVASQSPSADSPAPAVHRLLPSPDRGDVCCVRSSVYTARTGREASVVSTFSSAGDTVEAEVRELVRRRGLDPVEDRLAMRRLIDEVVLDYDERSLSSTMPALPDPRLAARGLRRRRRLRAAAAPPRRSRGRGDLDQRATRRRVDPPAGVDWLRSSARHGLALGLGGSIQVTIR